MFDSWGKSIDIDVVGLIGIGLTLLFSLAQLIRTFWGQLKAKAREEFVLENLQKIDTQLNNHITDLTKKVDAIGKQLGNCQQQRADYRIAMEGRVSKVEAKLEK